MYGSILKVHILPALGETALADITPAGGSEVALRPSRHGLEPDDGAEGVPVARRSILATAVDDDVLVKNPARVKGGGQERTSGTHHGVAPAGVRGWPMRSATGTAASCCTAGLAGLRVG